MNHARLTGLRARVGIAAAALWVGSAVIGGACARAGADEVPAAIVESARTLLEAQGQEWLASRDAYLQLPEVERAAALEYLARAEATKEEKTLALILRTRIERPDVAEKYDDAVARSLVDPQIGRSGAPMYHATMPNETDPANWPLSIELMWKRTDLPSHLRWTPRLALSNSPHIEPMLVILAENPEKGGELANALTSMAAARPDPRVLPALVSNYRYSRENKPEDTEHAHRILAHTATLGTAEAAAAVVQMREIERAHMQSHGWAPWNDVGAEEDLKQASHAMALAKQHRPLPDSKEPLTEAQQLYEDALQRKWRRWLWEQFDKTVGELRAKGLVR